jgi:adenylate cyclase
MKTLLLTSLVQDTPSQASQNENGRPSFEQQSTKSGKTSHKLRLPGHRHKNSNENKPAETRADISQPYPLRPVVSREDSVYSLRQNQPSALSSALGSKSNLLGRPSSPTPSSFSDMSRDPTSQRSPSTSKPRWILDHFMRKDKTNRQAPETLSNMPPSAVSLQPSIRTAKQSKSDYAQSTSTSKKDKLTGQASRIPPSVQAQHTNNPAERIQMKREQM